MKTFYLAAFATAALLTAPLAAKAMQDPQHPTTYAYVTGGIGDDERDALEMARHKYTLHIMNADRGGHFVSDAMITIYDHSGAQIMNADAGPLFYANLPAGKYSVSVSYNGAVQKRNVSIASGSASKLHFTWN